MPASTEDSEVDATTAKIEPDNDHGNSEEPQENVVSSEVKVDEPSEAQQKVEDDVGIPLDWMTELPPLMTDNPTGEYLVATEEESSGRPFDLVMVHGLGGSAESSWNNPNWGSAAFHEKYPKSRILTCNYVGTRPKGSVFTFEGIKELALEVLSDLLYYREEMGFSPDTIRPIVFVSHDIGGIIVKLALWIASLQYGKYRRILDSVRVLIFMGTPHRCISKGVLEDMVANLVTQTMAPNLFFSKAADKIKSLTDAIMQINGYFEITNLASLLNIVNVVSTTGKSTSIFNEYTATFGTAFEIIITKDDTPHSNLTLSPDLDRFYPAIDCILNTYPTKADDQSLDSMRVFRSILSPCSIRLNQPYPGTRFRCVVDHPLFTKWLEGYGTDLIYLYGSERLTEITKYITQELVKQNLKRTTIDKIVNFTFSRHDDRRNTVSSMLTTLLAQILCHFQGMTEFLVIEQMLYHRSWSQTELMVLFNSVLGHNDHTGIIVVLSSIDECDESRIMFLDDISRFLSLTEHRVKILITGTDYTSIKSQLGEHKSVDLQQPSLAEIEETSPKAELDCHFLELVHEYGMFSYHRADINTFLTQFNQNQENLNLASRYIKYNPQRIESGQIKSSIPKNTQQIFEQVLSAVSIDRRKWAYHVLLWVLYSYRPLKTWELGTALAIASGDLSNRGADFDEITGFPDVERNIEITFQGLLLVEGHEVRVGHSNLREFISSSAADAWYHVEDDSHAVIFEACLQYFELNEVHQRVSQRYRHEPVKGQSAVFPETFDDYYLPGESYYHRYSFASYAAIYWPKHYTKLPSNRILKAQAFLDNTKAYRAWEQVHWWTENPMNRRSRNFLSPLPVLANLGLGDLITLDKNTHQKDRAFALVEATRNGHSEIARALLKYKDYSISDMKTVMGTAGCCENEDFLIELVQYCADNFEPELRPGVVVPATESAQTDSPGAKEVVSSESKKDDDSGSGAKTSASIITNPEIASSKVSLSEKSEQQATEAEKKPSMEPGFPMAFNILCRAVVFSFEKLVRLLLKLGASVKVTSARRMTPLDFAVRQRNPVILKLIIDAGAELNVIQEMAYLPLHLAAIYGMPEMVQQLIDAGIDLNVKNTTNLTATYLAAWHRHPKAIEPLVKAGADLSNDTTGVWTPLTCCAQRDTRKCAEILLENGAKVDVVGFNDYTPLRTATIQEYEEFSNLLLEHGADPNDKHGSSRGPIINEVAGQGNLALVKRLIEHGADFKAVDSNQSSSFLRAALRGKTDVAEYLIDIGSDQHAQDLTGFNAVALAAWAGFPKMIEMLFKKGVDIHVRTQSKWMPIHYTYDDAVTTRTLLDLGADINSVADYYTPLILVATFNKANVLDVLLEYKPDLEIIYNHPTSNSGMTALSIATTYEYTLIVRTLLEAGCNINHQSTIGGYPLQYPVRDNNLGLLKLLLEYNPDQTLVNMHGNTALHCIGKTTNVEIARALVNAGAPLEIVNKKGYTPLGEAVSEGNLEITKYLIKKGANVNWVGGETGGPLHMAAKDNSFEFVTTLVEAKADVNLVDLHYGTAVQAACSRWPEGDGIQSRALKEKIIRYLIEEQHADLNVVGGDYGCALNAVCAFGSSEIVKLVLDKDVKINIPDIFGRFAIHLAASNGLQNFLHIHAAGANIELRDKIGRSPLHWAALGGNVDVIERILSLSRSLLDERDVDGWTPLHWAARGAGTAFNDRSLATKKAVIALLLKRGANPTLIAKGGGSGREWSVLSISRYNGNTGESEPVKEYMTWLIAAIKEKAADGTFDENAEVHQSKKAKERNEYCDSCLMTIFGPSYNCKTCPNIDFCTKCYQTISLIHQEGHEFYPVGDEFEEEETKAVDQKEGDEGKKEGDAGSSGSSDEEGNKKDRKGEEDSEGQKKDSDEKARHSDSDTDSDTDTDDE